VCIMDGESMNAVKFNKCSYWH